MPERSSEDQYIDEHLKQLEENEKRVTMAIGRITYDLRMYSGLDEQGAYLPLDRLSEMARNALKEELDALDAQTRLSLKRLAEILQTHLTTLEGGDTPV